MSMHLNLDSLIEIITRNFDDKDNIVYIHALKVCKIHRDPVQSYRFPKHTPLDKLHVEDFKKFKMRKSQKSAVEKPISVDYTDFAMIRILAGEKLENCIHEIGSGVESFALNVDTLNPMFKSVPSTNVLKLEPKIVDVIADLDSPSLSDTQVIFH